MKRSECIIQRKDGTLQPCEVMIENNRLKKLLSNADDNEEEWLRIRQEYAAKIEAANKTTKKLLQELIDRDVIKSWYYNGEYHWEY